MTVAHALPDARRLACAWAEAEPDGAATTPAPARASLLRHGPPPPQPGPAWGWRPERSSALAPWQAPTWLQAWRTWRLRARSARALRAARAGDGVRLPAWWDMAQARQAAWSALSEVESMVAREALRHRLRATDWTRRCQDTAPSRDGIPDARIDALACVAATLAQALGRNPYPTQWLAAAALLDREFVEMATGEGKTLAVAMAAGVAALAGVPVHVMTANDYLASRDAQLLAATWRRLGLRSTAVVDATPAEARAAAWRADIVHTTAREAAFDTLRDGLALAPRAPLAEAAAALQAGADAVQPRLPGLAFALLDEADSLLIDEASMPLVLSQPQGDAAAHRAACFQALGLARRLAPGQDFELEPGTTRLAWREAGRERLLAEVGTLARPAWRSAAHGQQLVDAALVALHALERDRHYLVVEGEPGREGRPERRIELIDTGTGRRAEGRVWSQGLQTMVELKEGCRATPPAATVSQTTYPRFFARYAWMAGISGTLAESAAELAATHARSIRPVPTRLPCRRIESAPRLFEDEATRLAWVVARAGVLQAEGRPLLVGVDTVAQAGALAERLAAAGLPHRVLDAAHDADEAAVIAAAGAPGALTVATGMAGRGTDILLQGDVAERGGLHVIACLDRPCARTLRQLVGRAGRQGDPGSVEVLLQREAPFWQAAPGWRRWLAGRGAGGLQALLRHGARELEARGREQRRRLLREDLAWQARLDGRP